MTEKVESPASQLRRFMAEYEPRIATIANGALRRLRKALPGAVELVYDNYAALVIGFAPTEKPSQAILSIGLYPRWVNLYFLRGATLHDPKRVLFGNGKQVRALRLDDARAMDAPAVRALLAQAKADADAPFSGKRRMIIKTAMAKRRARRPGQPLRGAKAEFASRDAWANVP